MNTKVKNWLAIEDLIIASCISICSYYANNYNLFTSQCYCKYFYWGMYLLMTVIAISNIKSTRNNFGNKTYFQSTLFLHFCAFYVFTLRNTTFYGRLQHANKRFKRKMTFLVKQSQ